MEVSVMQNSFSHQRPFKVSVVKKEKEWWQKFLTYFIPSHMNRHITQIIVAIFIFAILYGMLEEKALPGSEVFALLVIILSSILGGKLIELIKLPGLVGMILVGFSFRNIDSIPFYHHISKNTMSVLKQVALSIILFRAGLGLDKDSLKKMKFAVIRLTICPAVTEVISMGICGHFILGLPYIFSFMLGFIISAVSAEVCIPPVLELARKRYGIRKGVPALIIGAVSLDDIIFLAGFSVCFSIAFSTSNLTWTIIKAPLEPILGFIFAIVFGVIFWRFPSTNTPTGTLVYYNVMMAFFGSMTAMFLSHRVNFSGAGPITCIVLAFVASIKWRKNPKQFKGIYDAFLILWLIIEPILFAIIGGEITVEILKNNAGYALLSLFICLGFRTTMTATVTAGVNLNVKEKTFICCAFLPKASVQAAIGSQALDYARSHCKGEDLMQHGLTVLNVCILAIILTAPLASILINLLGPRLLTKDSVSILPEPDDEPSDDDDEEAVAEGKKLVSDYSSVNLLPYQK